jgi:acetoin utilization deacetylase AcuC-like enzyme
MRCLGRGAEVAAVLYTFAAMPAFAYVADELFERHAPPGAHPERPQRLAAVRAALERTGVAGAGLPIAARRAEASELALVHTEGYLRQLGQLAGRGGWIDADTYYAPATWEAALCAAGGAVDLARAVIRGDAQRGFAALRPPGHHAEADRAMGFCFLNNVAVAAAVARSEGLARVAIVDWDVHHGNGTQHIFERDGSVLYLSIHEAPLFPGTGAAEEIGLGEGVGATVNVPLPPGCGDAEYGEVFRRVVVPALRRFRPELILVSAGFDAHASDPLARMEVSEEGFAAMAEELAEAADELCEGRLVLALEGGYHLQALGQSVARVLEAIEPGVPRRGFGEAGMRALGVGLADTAIQATTRALAAAGVDLEAT